MTDHLTRASPPVPECDDPPCDRRWPAPVVVAALRAKYRAVPGISGYVHAELTCEFYEREVRLRYPLQVGRWGRLRGMTQVRWLDHGGLPVGATVVALGFGREDVLPGGGIRATVLALSPTSRERLVMHLPLGEVELPPVWPGPPRPWRNWAHCRRYRDLYRPPSNELDY